MGWSADVADVTKKKEIPRLFFVGIQSFYYFCNQLESFKNFVI